MHTHGHSNYESRNDHMHHIKQNTRLNTFKHAFFHSLGCLPILQSPLCRRVVRPESFVSGLIDPAQQGFVFRTVMPEANGEVGHGDKCAFMLGTTNLARHLVTLPPM